MTLDSIRNSCDVSNLKQYLKSHWLAFTFTPPKKLAHWNLNQYRLSKEKLFQNCPFDPGFFREVFPNDPFRLGLNKSLLKGVEFFLCSRNCISITHNSSPFSWVSSKFNRGAVKSLHGGIYYENFF